jgi:hypothetical protein
MKFALVMLLLLTGQSTKIESLSWMTGCWERTRGDMRWEETWSAPVNGVMHGSGRTTKAGSLVEYEITRIFERNDSLIYSAQPSGQPAAEFATVTATDGGVVFANPAHDFPQRVSYNRGADSLFARVEGTMKAKARGVDFRFKRVSCGDTAARERTIRGLDSLWARSYQVHDTAFALAIMAEDFVMMSSNGRMKDRATELKDIRPTAGLKMEYFRSRDVTVSTTDHTAEVSGLLEWKFNWNGRDNETKRSYTAKYQRGGPLGWRMVELSIKAVAP